MTTRSCSSVPAAAVYGTSGGAANTVAVPLATLARASHSALVDYGSGAFDVLEPLDKPGRPAARRSPCRRWLCGELRCHSGSLVTPCCERRTAGSVSKTVAHDHAVVASPQMGVAGIDHVSVHPHGRTLTFVELSAVGSDWRGVLRVDPRR